MIISSSVTPMNGNKFIASRIGADGFLGGHSHEGHRSNHELGGVTVRALRMACGALCLCLLAGFSGSQFPRLRGPTATIGGHDIIAAYSARLGGPLAHVCFFPDGLLALPGDRYLIGCGAGFGGGFALLDRGKGTFTEIAVSDKISAFAGPMYRSADDIIWRGGWSAGTMRIDGQSLVPVTQGDMISLNLFSFVFSGIGGAVWVCGPRGLFRYNDGVFTGPILPGPSIDRLYEQLPDPHPPTIHGYGRNRDVTGPRPIKNENGLPLVKPMRESVCGVTDSKGIVWIVAARALLRLDPASNEWSLYPRPEVYERYDMSYIGQDGVIWLASSDGDVQRYDQRRNSWNSLEVAAHVRFPPLEKLPTPKPGAPPPPITDFRLTGMLADAQGQMIFATNMGLVIFDPQTECWTRCTASDSALPDDTVTSIVQGSRNEIWVVTLAGILTLRDGPK